MVVRMFPLLAALLLAGSGGAAGGQQPETMSLLGEPLFARSLGKAERARAESDLAAAHTAYAKEPASPAAIVALERAYLALGRVGNALEVLTHGIEANPEDATLHLERGKGYILIRKFDVAERDLRKAAATLPAARCALAFAQYLGGDFARASASYRSCGEPGVFGYLADRRAGQTVGARPTPDGPAPPVSPAIRLPGAVASSNAGTPQPTAAAYLAAVERLLEGDAAAARDQLKKIVESRRKEWMDPAYIAAEADYVRIKAPEKRKRKG